MVEHGSFYNASYEDFCTVSSNLTNHSRIQDAKYICEITIKLIFNSLLKWVSLSQIIFQSHLFKKKKTINLALSSRNTLVIIMPINRFFSNEKSKYDFNPVFKRFC